MSSEYVLQAVSKPKEVSICSFFKSPSIVLGQPITCTPYFPGMGLVVGQTLSPAARAGLQSGDVILALNGKEIQSSSELPPLVANIRPGETAKLQIWRKGGKREVEVKVGGLKEEKTASVEDKETAQGRLGLALRPLTPAERRQLDGKEGLLVENVSGAAARAGIRPGDVVLSVNGESVTSVEQLRSLVGKASKRVALLIQRRDARLFVPVDLG